MSGELAAPIVTCDLCAAWDEHFRIKAQLWFAFSRAREDGVGVAIAGMIAIVEVSSYDQIFLISSEVS